jgi:hypothetical protein
MGFHSQLSTCRHLLPQFLNSRPRFHDAGTHCFLPTTSDVGRRASRCRSDRTRAENRSPAPGPKSVHSTERVANTNRTDAPDVCQGLLRCVTHTRVKSRSTGIQYILAPNSPTPMGPLPQPPRSAAPDLSVQFNSSTASLMGAGRRKAESEKRKHIWKATTNMGRDLQVRGSAFSDRCACKRLGTVAKGDTKSTALPRGLD